jgi:hypothetical protein
MTGPVKSVQIYTVKVRLLDQLIVKYVQNVDLNVKDRLTTEC